MPISGARPACSAATTAVQKSHLIPSQELPGECHQQSKQQQSGAGQPVHLTRVFVRPHQVHPNGMQTDEDDHGRGAKVVDAANDPAYGGTGDEAEAVISLPGARYVSAGERNSCHYLHQESNEGRTAEHIKPPGLAGLWHGVRHDGAE